MFQSRNLGISNKEAWGSVPSEATPAGKQVGVLDGNGGGGCA